MSIKKTLPYLGIPLLITAYLMLIPKETEVIRIICSITLISFMYIAAYLDFKTRKIPNRLVLVMLVVWLVIASGYVIFDINAAIQFLIQAAISGIAAGSFFMFIYIVSRKSVGGGDVKLMAVSGLFLTLAKLLPMIFVSSLLAAIASALLLITNRATMKTAIPLVPFLFAGVLIVIFM